MGLARRGATAEGGRRRFWTYPVRSPDEAHRVLEIVPDGVRIISPTVSAQVLRRLPYLGLVAAFVAFVDVAGTSLTGPLLGVGLVAVLASIPVWFLAVLLIETRIWDFVVDRPREVVEARLRSVNPAAVPVQVRVAPVRRTVDGRSYDIETPQAWAEWELVILGRPRNVIEALRVAQRSL